MAGYSNSTADFFLLLGRYNFHAAEDAIITDSFFVRDPRLQEILKFFVNLEREYVNLSFVSHPYGIQSKYGQLLERMRQIVLARDIDTPLVREIVSVANIVCNARVNAATIYNEVLSAEILPVATRIIECSKILNRISLELSKDPRALFLLCISHELHCFSSLLLAQDAANCYNFKETMCFLTDAGQHIKQWRAVRGPAADDIFIPLVTVITRIYVRIYSKATLLFHSSLGSPAPLTDRLPLEDDFHARFCNIQRSFGTFFVAIYVHVYGLPFTLSYVLPEINTQVFNSETIGLKVVYLIINNL